MRFRSAAHRNIGPYLFRLLLPDLYPLPIDGAIYELS